jgi:hypothetical protein
MSSESPKLSDDIILAVSRAVFGGQRSWISVILIALLLVSMSLFSNAITGNVQGTAAKWVYYGLFPALMVVFVLAVRRAARHVNLIIVQDENPASTKALVLFLSPPGQDTERIAAMSRDAGVRGRIEDLSLREQFKSSWRMPLEAIAHHRSRLRWVVVIPSRDGDLRQDGTWRSLEDFRKLVTALAEKPNLQIRSLAELTSKELWAEGVDFEDAQMLVDSIDATYSALNAAGIEDSEIMVDVTGGQKPTSIAGAAVALEKRRRKFQYVSTRGFRIQAYDITYRSE